MNTVHTLPPYIPKVHYYIVFPSTPRSWEWCLPFKFSNQIFSVFHIYSMRATRPAYLIFLYFFTLIIYGEAYKLWSSSLCSFLQPATPFSLLGRNVLSTTLLSYTLIICSFPSVMDQLSHSYQTTVTILFSYILICKFPQRGSVKIILRVRPVSRYFNNFRC